MDKVQLETSNGQKHDTFLRRLSLPVTLFLLISPVVLVAVFLCVREFDHQTSHALEHRSVIAELGASIVHEDFDGIVGVGEALVSRTTVRDDIEKGEWGKAMENFDGARKAFPYIDTISFLNKEGELKAITPPNPEILGKSFAYRDYYQGVSKEWKPYVSEAFTSVIAPKHHIITVSVPVLSFDQKVIGILVLAINIDTIIGWSKGLDVGTGGFVYIVDKKGQLVSHPNLRHEDELVDYSSVVTVQKLLRGERGVEVLYNSVDKEERMTAYAPVEEYGFGVAVVQPARIAFAERDSKVTEYIFFWTLIVLILSFTFFRILKDRATIMAQRDRDQFLLESIGDGIVAIDRSWNITLWNKAATAITGWNADEAMGKQFRSIVKFVRERDRRENISFIEDAIVMGHVSFMESDTVLVKKDGSEIPVGDSAAPIVGRNGAIEGAIIVFRDVSKEHEAGHLRSDLTYASHQLRTPVTEALWNLETGIKEQDPQKREEDLRVAYQAVLSIQKLSEHLVYVSEVDQGNITINSSPLKLIDILVEVQNKLGSEAKSRGVEIHVSPVSPLAAVNSDSRLLKRILCEIVENAVLYSDQGDTVTVSATFHEKELHIEVIDVGMGISEEQLPLIFTKFFRGTNSVRKSAGSGLGLYLAKAYVVLLGGKIWFESKEGEGTTFFISLPM